ncbi:MAG: hypothetical protein AABX12_01180 [Nanoarchaeota archaeon]
MEKGSVIRFADKALQDTFYNLQNGDEQEKEMFQLVNQAMDNLQKNAFCGIQIPKKQIPKLYEQQYGTTNLWKYDLPRGWRLIYTIKGENAVIVSIILEWFFSHKEYERRFNY